MIFLRLISGFNKNPKIGRSKLAGVEGGMYFHQMNPQQQFQWNWMFWFRALVKFQMLFEIESRLQRRQQTKTLTCNFRPESENVDGPEWDLGSQAINLLKVFIFFFLPLATRLFQICRH